MAVRGRFCRLLDEMLKDEDKAPGDYSKLAKTTSSASIKKKIASIKKDERKHYRILKRIKKEAC